MTVLAILSTQVIDTTTVGRAVMTAATAAAARTAIGAGVGDVLTTGSYSNPSWITSLAWSKISTTPTTLSGYGITDAITSAAVAAGYQPLDADLTALAGLTGTNNIYYRSAADTWSSVTIGTGLTFTGGTLAASGGAGIGGSTGAVDNAVLRADGTGGATLQASAIVIPDNFTASPNNTVNHASLQATGGTTNVSVSVVPKGTGSFSLHVPDGTATGGNARGANAIDLQTVRDAANKVASGIYSILIGSGGTASSQYCVSIGNNCSATNYGSFAVGIAANASGNQAFVIAWGNGSTGSGNGAWVVGDGALGDRAQIAAYASGRFAAVGDAQEVKWVLRNKTTDGTTAVTLFANGVSTRCLLTSGKVLHATVQIVGSKSDGSAVASYLRQVTIKNVGGTTSLVGTVNTIGTDEAAGTSIAITADNTNDALQIAVTGVAGETWRWVATVVGPELAYGT